MTGVGELNWTAGDFFVDFNHLWDIIRRKMVSRKGKNLAIEFDRGFYEKEAVAEVSDVFSEFGKIEFEEKDSAWVLNISFGFEERTQKKLIIGEILNFVLARTIELRSG